jgi:hypothetical protein
MHALGNNLAFWLAMIGGLAVLFLVPTIVGTIRRVEHLGIVIGLNFIPILWPAALLGAAPSSATASSAKAAPAGPPASHAANRCSTIPPASCSPSSTSGRRAP